MIILSPFLTLKRKFNIAKNELNDTADLFEMRKVPRMNEYTDTKPDENINQTIAYVDKMNKGILFYKSMPF